MTNVHMVNFLVEGTIPPLEMLNGAGGVFSFIKRSLVGYDMMVIRDLEDQIRKIKNAKEKRKTLNELDYFIAEVYNVIQEANPVNIVSRSVRHGLERQSVVSAMVSGAVNYAITSLKVNNKSFIEYHTRLIELRNSVEKLEFSK